MRARREILFALGCALTAWVAVPAFADCGLPHDDEAHAGHEHGEEHAEHGEEHAGHGDVQAAAMQQQGEMSAEQQAMMAAWQEAMTPGPEHAHLAEMAGDWKLEVTMWEEPGAEPSKSTATAKRTMMWDRVLVEEVEGNMMGMPFKGQGMTGYDNVADEYWGTWTDNMSTGVMTSTGTWDEESGTATFWGTTTDPMSGEEMKVKSVLKPSQDKEVMEMYMVHDGQEMKTMEIVYTRQ